MLLAYYSEQEKILLLIKAIALGSLHVQVDIIAWNIL